SVHAIMLKPQTMSGAGKLMRGLVFAGILAVSGLVAAFSPLTGTILCLFALAVFIFTGFKPYQGRNLLLLLYAHCVVGLVVMGMAMSNPAIRQFFVGHSNTTLSFEEGLALLLGSGIIGVVAAIVVVTIPFALVVAAAAAVVSKWHVGNDQTFTSAFFHTLYTILSVLHFVVVAEDGELKGHQDGKERLEKFGGPGWLNVYPQQVVALHIQGKITRVVGAGTVMLKRGERVKAILPLSPKGGVATMENVLTRDRIALNVSVLHAARIEPAGDTQVRLQKEAVAAEANLSQLISENASSTAVEAAQQSVEAARQKLQALKNDPVVGDELFQVYESIARLAALRAPDPYNAVKFAILNNLKDAIMSEFSEDLFKIEEDNGDLDAKINRRKIKEIEDLVTKKSMAFGMGKGTKLLIVDIADITFPPEIKDKIEQQVKTLIEEKIQETEARIAESKAKANMIAARAKAQAAIMAGKGEGEARAALFREILRELKRERLPQEQIASAMLGLISATTSVKEMKDLFKSSSFLHRRYPELMAEQGNGSMVE
ncbi:MAG: hypothetical protein KDJ52_20695, partial [Anaerolineae bacterium]|nr:hypothetical protein [Anaerolineae bacterium]